MQAETICTLAVVAPDDFRRLVFAQLSVDSRPGQTVFRVLLPIGEAGGGGSVSSAAA